jgi:hypothetical protein
MVRAAGTATIGGPSISQETTINIHGVSDPREAANIVAGKQQGIMSNGVQQLTQGRVNGYSVDTFNLQSRKIGVIIPDVVVSEKHSDTLEITEHPVETGAAISDHAYKRPAKW